MSKYLIELALEEKFEERLRELDWKLHHDQKAFRAELAEYQQHAREEIAAERERCAGICKGIAEEYGRLSAGQSARVDALRHGLTAIANKARAPAEIIASRVLAADDVCTEINQSVGYAVARECARRIRGDE